jgi:hypothetical protein
MDDIHWGKRMLPLFLTIFTVGGALAIAFS